MNRIHAHRTLALLAVAALTAPLFAQDAKQEPPKERPKVEKAERVKEAPKQAPKERAPAAEAPKAEAPVAGAPGVNPREVAKKAAQFESVHRDRIARIDRLIEIYTAKGDREKVTELQALRDAQAKRHDNAMQNFRKQLGPNWSARLDKELKGPSERARDVREKPAEKPVREKPEEPKKERSKETPASRPGGKQ
ncbi:MAG: hypothetical protein IPJ19_20290 [Planctomycetes bacterium]|nr:hypothetical protein [Planctomycetota bacterium]